MLTLADRRELGSFFSGLNRTVLRSISGDVALNAQRLLRDEAILEFGDRPDKGDLPIRIIVRDEDLQDFFAWTSTFIDTLSPLTGFIAVSSASEATRSRIAPKIGVQARNGLAGAVIMDGLLQSKARTRVPDAVLPASLRTLSAVFYQAIVSGSATAEIADAAGLWTLTRETLGSSEMPFSISDVLAFWASVATVFLNPQDVDDLGRVVQLYLTDEGDYSPWRNGPWEAYFNIDFRRIARAPREDRLRYVDRLLSSVPQSVDANVRAAFAGYMLAVIADGDFNFWPTSTTFTSLPTTPLWFGLFAGGNRESNLLTANQSVGRRLLNLLRFRADDIDIDARELIISRRVRTKANSAVDFPLATYNVLKARLATDVCGWFSVREPQQAASTSSRDADRQRALELRATVEARAMAERIVQLLSPIVHGLPNRDRHPSSQGPNGGQPLPRPQRDAEFSGTTAYSEELFPLDAQPRTERKSPAKSKKKRP
jgi:hypothetical protein